MCPFRCVKLFTCKEITDDLENKMFRPASIVTIDVNLTLSYVEKVRLQQCAHANQHILNFNLNNRNEF